MKRKICFFVLFFMLINLSLYAFENDFFNVSDTGWKYEKGPENNSFIFVMKDFEKLDFKSIVPLIKVVVTENGEKKYIKDNKTYMSEAKEEAEKLYKKQLAITKGIMTQAIKSRFTSISDKKLEEMIENEIGETGIKEPHIDYLDKQKAVVVNYNVNFAQTRVISVLTLNRLYTITVVYSDPTDLDGLDQYKKFISSFKIKDKEATYFNAVTKPILMWVFGGFLAIIILLILKKVLS